MSRYLHLRRLESEQPAVATASRLRLPALLLLSALSSVIAAFGLPMGAASAAHVAPRSLAHVTHAVMPRTSTFCTLAQAAEANSNTTSVAGEKVPSLQAAYAKLKVEEPQIISIAPSQIKGDFQALFAYVNQFYAALASVKYVYTKLPPSYYKALAKVNIKQIEADGKAITTYLTNVCHVKK